MPRSSTSPRRSTKTRTATAWLIRIRLGDPSEADALLDVAAYKQVVAES